MNGGTTVIDPPEADPDRHFRTDHLMADLKGRSVRGGAITLAAQAIKFVLQLTSTVILARLLTPADFGLVAMVTAITGFVAMFKDLGLSQATVQRAEINQQQVSTLFWINVALSAGLMLLVMAISPLIAKFYGDPRLTGITVALAGTFIFGGLTVQHGALLTRQMRFRALAIIDILSLASGVAVAVTMAWMGFGYWALVGMPAGQAIVNCLLVWAVSGWMPGRPARGSGVRDMLKFGGYLAGFNVVNYFSRNADNVLIGRVWGDAALGIYSRAYQLLTLPLSAAVYPLNSVVIPSLSRLQTRGREFRDTYLAFVRAAAILTFGVIATLLAVGDVLIPSLLGQKWQSATLVFQILAIAAPLQVVCGTCGSLYVSLGRGRRLLKWSSWYSAVIVASFVVGLPWGIVGVATSYVCAFYLTVPACLWYATAGTELRWWDAATVSILPFAAGLLTWLAGTATRFMIGNSHPWWVIATISFVCLITYISVVIVASRDSARNLLILLTSAYRAT